VPNYEYQCTHCNHLFEIWQNVGEAAPPCPECGSDVKKVFHPPRVIFKGSGFYVTDLRAEQAAKKSGKNGKAESSGTGESSSAGSDSSSGDSSTTATSGETAKSETKAEAAPTTSTSNDKK